MLNRKVNLATDLRLDTLLDDECFQDASVCVLRVAKVKDF